MSISAASTSSRSNISVATGFLGAFIVGSLAVQMVRSQTGIALKSNPRPVNIAPVIASQATLWGELGSRSNAVETSASIPVTSTTKSADIKPVVGSEATLWSAFGSR